MNDSLPWIEKYRPRKLEDIILEPHVKTKMMKMIEEKDMPNIIITGIPGIGKTTTLLCIARHFYGHYCKDAVLEINASDDRGIKSVQTDVVDFCNIKLGIKEEDVDKYAKHKLVIFDEADNITEKAQHLISMIIEKYHRTTRFAFTCNTSSDIIESIQSRCKILRYMRLDYKAIANRLRSIMKMENVKHTDDALKSIAYMSEGDMRHALNLAQLTYNRFNIINIDNVTQVCKMPHPNIIKEILLKCIAKQFRESYTQTINLKKQGFTGYDILSSIITTLKLPLTDDINQKNKIFIMQKTCDYLYGISKSMDTDIQLTSYIVELNQQKN